MFSLTSQRLVLRDLIAADWAMIHALSNEPAVTRFQTWLRLSDEAAAHAWVQQSIVHNQAQPRYAYNLAIVHQDKAIGWIGWGMPSDRTLGDRDFGYALHPAAWGQGYMTEALRAACGFMFSSPDVQRIFGECAADNPASARVMQKIGMRLVHTWTEPDATTGQLTAHQRYAIDRPAWRV